MDIQAGDVAEVANNATPLQDVFDYKIEIPVEEGVKRFVEWYKTYKNKK